MVNNKTIAVVINIHRLRREVSHHNSPIFSTDTNFGLSFNDVLQLLAAIAPYADDEDMVAEMSYDIADALEFGDGNDYQALVGLINDSAKYITNDLGVAVKQYPGRDAYFSEIIGDSAHFLLE